MEIEFYESTRYMYLQTKVDIHVPAKMEIQARYMNPGVIVKNNKSCPIATLLATEPTQEFIPKVADAIIQSAQADVLPGSADYVDFVVRLGGVGDIIIKLHLFMGNRNIFVASSQYIAGYVMYGIFKNTFSKKTAKELKELLGIPLDDPKYKF